MSTVAFDFAGMSGRDRYKLLANTILPRPIALVVSESGAGLRNAAPFSFFNVFSEDPPVVILGVGAQSRRPGQHKDTTKNIEETGEFTINLVDEALVPQMGICSIDFPSATDELVVSELQTIDSLRIKPPRIVASPVQIECSRTLTLSLGGLGQDADSRRGADASRDGKRDRSGYFARRPRSTRARGPCRQRRLVFAYSRPVSGEGSYARGMGGGG